MFTGGFHETTMRNGAAKAGISALIVLKYIYYYTSHLSTIRKLGTEELRRQLKNISIHTFCFPHFEHLYTLYIAF